MSQEEIEIDRWITLKLEKNKIICFSKSTKGEIIEERRIKYKGSPKEIKVHPVFLQDILSHLKQLIIGDRLLFKGEGFNHVISLSE